MKKIISIMCAAALCAGLVSCSSVPANTVKSISDLEGKTIGVMSGSTGDALASAEIKDADVEKYTKYSTAISDLKKGELDAVIMNDDTADELIENDSDVKLLGESFATEEYGIAVSLDNHKLLDEINGALEDIKRDGTLDNIISSYKKDTDNAYSDEGNNGKKGRLRMATFADFPPYEYREDGDFKGIDIDMMRAICNRLGYELQITDISFDAVLSSVESGKSDVGVSGITINDERSKQVMFSEPYCTTELVVVVRAK